MTKDAKVLSALQSLKEVAAKTAEYCLTNEWKKLPDIFEQEYKFRIQLTESFSSPEIRQIKEISQKTGRSQKNWRREGAAAFLSGQLLRSDLKL